MVIGQACTPRRVPAVNNASPLPALRRWLSCHVGRLINGEMPRMYVFGRAILPADDALPSIRCMHDVDRVTPPVRARDPGRLTCKLGNPRGVIDPWPGSGRSGRTAVSVLVLILLWREVVHDYAGYAGASACEDGVGMLA
jgi:hypothetical protein